MVGGRAVLAAVLVVAGAGCADDEATPDASVDAVCDEYLAMDASALGVTSGPPEAVATALASEVLGWDDATVEPGDSACQFTISRTSGGTPVSMHTAGVGPDARFSYASSFTSDDDAPLSVQFLGDQAAVGTPATCDGCTGATVHIVHRGGVVSQDVALPVDVRTTLPAGATERGIVILFRDGDGVVQAVLATTIRDGDFAAG